MTDADEILDAMAVYSEDEILAEFQSCCEAEAEEPGHHWGRVNRAAEDLCQMLNRKNRAVQTKKK